METSTYAPRLGLLAAAAALTLLTPLAVTGEEPEAGPEDPAAQSVEEQPVSTAAGLVAFVDPVTGEITSEPSREQVEALSSALKSSLTRTAEGLEPFALSGGGRGVYLAGRFHTATVIEKHPDGRLTLGCVDHSEAEAAAPSPAPEAPVWEEK